MLLETLIASLRELRATLIAGWLWLVWIWLAFAATVPKPGDGTVFRRVYDLGYSLGPAGSFAVGSLAAYCVGSLVYDGQRFLAARSMRRRQRQDTSIGAGDRGTLHLVDLVPLVAGLAPTTPINRAPWRRKARLAAKARDLIVTATTPERLDARAALERAGDHEVTVIEHRYDYVRVARVGLHDDELVVPILPTARRLLEDADLIRSRLADCAGETSNRVERLYSESDLRLATALPILALGVTACINSLGNLALLLPLVASTLVIPAGVALQGVATRQRAADQLIDAVRTRRSTVSLETFTPLFERYQSRARSLCGRLATEGESR